MSTRIQALKDQLEKVYALMGVTGRRGQQRVVFGEGAFGELLQFIDMAPDDKLTDLIYRMSGDHPPLFIAAVFNILVWSAESGETVDVEEIAEWFYSDQAKKVEIALQVDIFPSNSMEESQRILTEIERKFPHLRQLCADLKAEVDHRLEEEESWAKYRRDTFEMPKEMTGSILNIIRDIKG
ncbi:hypothetical protein [Neolewinella antarctica]|uniref:Uncharacterized protein n=1 Tax=Neolewinella antarctica TaxID=442734 RepID=A0ABX0XH02_9BACT|nr:hypothetical protein [Neolewinella antarctica]NJC28153.1 hypothetical protein [Neolewinella antarctica]